MKIEMTWKEYIDNLAIAHTDESDFRPINDSLDAIAVHVYKSITDIFKANIGISLNTIAQYNGNSMTFTFIEPATLNVGICWINEIDVDEFLSKVGLKECYYNNEEFYEISELQSILISHMDTYFSNILIYLFGYTMNGIVHIIKTNDKYDTNIDTIVQKFKENSTNPTYILNHETVDETTFIKELKAFYIEK